MDKLKPIITHKFWIFFGLAIMLPVIGWWPATNQKNTNIDQQTKAIDQSFTTANKDRTKFGNNIWHKGITKVNHVEDQRLTHANYLLWEHQRKEQIWPDVYLTERIKDVPRITEENYKQIDKNFAYAYKNFYDKATRELYLRLDPYEAKPTSTDKLKETGLVALRGKENALPFFNTSNWEDNPPHMLTVAEAQEDLWLLSSIIDAIVTMNDGSISIADSTIKVIEDIEFVGGSGVGHPAPGSTKKKKKKAKVDPNARSDVALISGALQGKDLKEGLPLRYHPGEIFGIQQGSTQTVKAKTPTAGAGMKFSLGAGSRDKKKSRRRGAGGKGLGSYSKQVRTRYQGKYRYVDLATKTTPYNTRGFHLHLVMDHRKIPQFIEELSKSPWLIRVYRYQFQNERISGSLDGVVPLNELTSESANGVRRSKKKKRFGGFKRGKDDDDEENEEARRKANSKKEGKKLTGYELALADPYLVEVYISGKFAIYLPVEAPASIKEETEVAEAEASVTTEEDTAEADSESQKSDKKDSTGEEIPVGTQPANKDKSDNNKEKPIKPQEGKTENSVTLTEGKNPPPN